MKLTASEIVYSDSIDGLRKQLQFEAEYTDMLETKLSAFVALADEVRHLAEMQDSGR